MLFITGCVNPEEVVVNSAELYFDIPTFVKNYENTHSNAKVTKKVVLNNKEETQEIADYNLKQELDLMSAFDINKPSMGGKYTKNEIQEDNGAIRTVYSANEKDLKTQEVEVIRSQNEIVTIKITGAQKTILSENNQSIIFAPEKSYHLLSEDKNTFGKKIKKEILITFN
jgi:hypothetical protein